MIAVLFLVTPVLIWLHLTGGDRVGMLTTDVLPLREEPAP